MAARNLVRILRAVLARADGVLARFDVRPLRESAPPPDPERHQAMVSFLRSLDQPADARAYLEMHLERLARTLTLVPPPGLSGRVLELGSYMQMTPVLHRMIGYREVRAAYYGQVGLTKTKAVAANGAEIFRCDIDLFDAERDEFPYPAEHFDTVLACEILEHLLHDPMHMLLEIRRVLLDGGALLVTTPNTASLSSVGRLLRAAGHPQIFSKYANPDRPDSELEIPHVREYTPHEIKQALEAAGFDIVHLFTEPIAGMSPELWTHAFLKKHGLPASLRGEQIYCLARKKPSAAILRYPGFLYER